MSHVAGEAIEKAQPDWQKSCDLTEQDRIVIQDVDRALADGLQLRRWWELKDAASDYQKCFPLVRTGQPETDWSIGFFDSALLNGKDFPVMGLVQEMLFDQPKQASIKDVRDEFREFILHYLLRVSSFSEPGPFIGKGEQTKADVARELQPFSFCPQPTDTKTGFGYSQLYYKLRESGVVGKFPERRQSKVVDLREIGEKYEWIALQVNLFNFNFAYSPFAESPVSLVFPLKEATYIAINRDFITNRDNPRPDLLGEYGFGYALLKPAPEKSIFAYGPGFFTAGFQLVNFEVLKNGQTRARLAFVANKPEKVINLDINFVGLGFGFADLMSFGLASRLFAPVKGLLKQFSPRISNFDPVSAYISISNALSGGRAATDLCASLEALERNPMLVTHFLEHYQLIVGALLTWRRVQSWLTPADIPESVREGTST